MTHLDSGGNRETLEQQVGAVLWKMQDSQFAGHTLPPSQVAAEVIAMVREQIAREIEAENDPGAGFADLWNQAIKRAAHIARREAYVPPNPGLPPRPRKRGT